MSGGWEWNCGSIASQNGWQYGFSGVINQMWACTRSGWSGTYFLIAENISIVWQASLIVGHEAESLELGIPVRRLMILLGCE